MNERPTEPVPIAEASPRRRRIRLRSIRGTLLAWQALLLAGALAVFGGLVYQRERDMVMKDVDKKLAERAGALMSGLDLSASEPAVRLSPEERRHYRTDRPDAYYFAVWSADGTLVEASRSEISLSPSSDLIDLDDAPSNDTPAPPEPADQPAAEQGPRDRRKPRPPQLGLIDDEGVKERLFAGPGGAQILVGKALSGEHDRLLRLLGQLVLSGGGLLAVGVLGGWGLSRLAIRPIERLSQTAAGISASTLSARLDESDAPVELRHLTEILNSTFARLEASFARQRQFTADAAHELRTPLTVVLTQTELALARERTGEEYRRSFETCHRAARRMKELTECLLELARSDSGEFELKRQRFALAGIVRRAADWHTAAADERNVKLNLQLDGHIACLCDAELLAQAVGNLISNAIRYNVDGGRVDISVLAADDVDGGEAIVRVADTGVGIAEEHQARVFDRFYRVDPARSRQAGGSGLGLAICQQIVAAHGGRITLSSRSGQGSTFEIRLPRSTAGRPPNY
jgi:heavy metal sensor kinase